MVGRGHLLRSENVRTLKSSAAALELEDYLVEYPNGLYTEKTKTVLPYLYAMSEHIYNVTVAVDSSVEAQWKEWILKTHIQR